MGHSITLCSYLLQHSYIRMDIDNTKSNLETFWCTGGSTEELGPDVEVLNQRRDDALYLCPYPKGTFLCPETNERLHESAVCKVLQYVCNTLRCIHQGVPQIGCRIPSLLFLVLQWHSQQVLLLCLECAE